MRRWIALLSKPRMERRVARALEARGIPCFVPLLEYHGKRGNALDKPFFPRYLFAHLDWEREGDGLQWTPGLSRVVTFDGQPAWLPDAVVEDLAAELEALDGDAFLALKPGERVRVARGPMKDLEAVFETRLNGEGRAAVLLEILGRQTRVVLDEDDLDRLR